MEYTIGRKKIINELTPLWSEDWNGSADRTWVEDAQWTTSYSHSTTAREFLYTNNAARGDVYNIADNANILLADKDCWFETKIKPESVSSLAVNDEVFVSIAWITAADYGAGGTDGYQAGIKFKKTSASTLGWYIVDLTDNSEELITSTGTTTTSYFLWSVKSADDPEVLTPTRARVWYSTDSLADDDTVPSNLSYFGNVKLDNKGSGVPGFYWAAQQPTTNTIGGGHSVFFAKAYTTSGRIPDGVYEFTILYGTRGSATLTGRIPDTTNNYYYTMVHIEDSISATFPKCDFAIAGSNFSLEDGAPVVVVSNYGGAYEEIVFGGFLVESRAEKTIPGSHFYCYGWTGILSARFPNFDAAVNTGTIYDLEDSANGKRHFIRLNLTTAVGTYSDYNNLYGIIASESTSIVWGKSWPIIGGEEDGSYPGDKTRVRFEVTTEGETEGVETSGLTVNETVTIGWRTSDLAAEFAETYMELNEVVPDITDVDDSSNYIAGKFKHMSALEAMNVMGREDKCRFYTTTKIAISSGSMVYEVYYHYKRFGFVDSGARFLDTDTERSKFFEIEYDQRTQERVNRVTIQGNGFVVVEEDLAGQSEFGAINEKIITDKRITNREEARRRAAEIIAVSRKALPAGVIHMAEFVDARIGEQVYVDLPNDADADNNQRYYEVHSREIFYPGEYVYEISRLMSTYATIFSRDEDNLGDMLKELQDLRRDSLLEDEVDSLVVKSFFDSMHVELALEVESRPVVDVMIVGNGSVGTNVVGANTTPQTWSTVTL